MYMTCTWVVMFKIVKKSCTTYVYVWETCTCRKRVDIQGVKRQIVPLCTCLGKILKKIAFVIEIWQGGRGARALPICTELGANTERDANTKLGANEI